MAAMGARASKALLDGVGFGITAGMLFAIAQMAEAVGTGAHALTPYRPFASVFVGERALESLSMGAATFVGLGVHLTLSALFGGLYNLIISYRSLETRVAWGRQAGLGLLFGLGIWALNVQLIARLFYPWFLELPQLAQAGLHAVAFGLPVALMSVAAERRGRLVTVSPAQRVA